MKSEKSMEIIKPKVQLNLFGYENHFKFFDKLYEKNKLPNSMLLSGPKGLGKSTFIYHFINYLLSKDEKYNYDFSVKPSAIQMKETVVTAVKRKEKITEATKKEGSG